MYLGRFNADITRALLPDFSEEERAHVGQRKDLLFRQFAKDNLRATKGLDKICIGLLTSASKETLQSYGTWRTVMNFDEIDLDEIQRVLHR